MSREVALQLGCVEAFKLACEHFRQDIAAHWTQASFFAVIQAAFISVFAAAVGPRERDNLSLVTPEVPALGLAAAGLIFALLWFFTARGREKYIRLWRDQVVHLGRVVDRHHVYVKVERIAAEDPYNPTVLTTLLPALICWGWVVAGSWTLMLEQQRQLTMSGLQHVGWFAGGLGLALLLLGLTMGPFRDIRAQLRVGEQRTKVIARVFLEFLVLRSRKWAVTSTVGLLLLLILGGGVLLAGST